MKKIGVYVHIPFCERKCPYCDFYSRPGNAAAYEKYRDALIRSIPRQSDCLADSVYFGGGTPSLFYREIKSVLGAINGKIPLADDCEITAEVNPHSSPEEVLCTLRESGINRLSVGVQSFVPSELVTLGRLHTAADAEKTFRAARRAGFDNISVDLMLSVFGQTADSTRESLAAVAELSPEHLSAYMLKLEPGTPFFGRELPDEDFIAEQYLMFCEEAEKQGLMQYEISNFARPGFESRHNLRYWRCGEYLGLGAAAHSYMNGKRFFYPRDTDAFIAGCAPVCDGDGGGDEEKIMLGLRLKEGVETSLLGGRDVKFIRAGLMERNGERSALTRRGFLVSNSVITELI